MKHQLPNDPKAHPAGRVLGEGVYLARTNNRGSGLLDFIFTNVCEAAPLTREVLETYAWQIGWEAR